MYIDISIIHKNWTIVCNLIEKKYMHRKYIHRKNFLYIPKYIPKYLKNIHVLSNSIFVCTYLAGKNEQFKINIL